MTLAGAWAAVRNAVRNGGRPGIASAAISETTTALSGDTGPALHAHAACAMPSMRHLEYFHDHVRIEEQLFDGVLQPVGGALRPDRARPGMGLELKREDAEQFRL